MKLQYERWHGCHNRFYVISCDHQEENWEYRRLRDLLIRGAPQICRASPTRKTVDGILLLKSLSALPHVHPVYSLTIINRDGSLALNCGNGLRVACLAIVSQGAPGNKKAVKGGYIDFIVETAPPGLTEQDLGKSPLRYTTRPATQNVHHRPQTQLPSSSDPTELHWGEVTMTLKPGNLSTGGLLPWGADVRSIIEKCAAEHLPHTHSRDIRFSFWNLGNDHLFAFSPYSPQPPPRETIASWAEELAEMFQSRGIAVPNMHHYYIGVTRELQRDEAKKLSLHYSPDTLVITPWERGVGLTLACGSGAVAASWDYYFHHAHKKAQPRTPSSPLPSPSPWRGIQMPGGSMWTQMSWEGPSASVMPDAPATMSPQHSLPIPPPIPTPTPTPPTSITLLGDAALEKRGAWKQV